MTCCNLNPCHTLNCPHPTLPHPQHYRKAALQTDSISLESRQGNKRADGAADELGNQIGETQTPDPEDATQAFYMKGKVTALLATLKEKERQVCAGLASPFFFFFFIFWCGFFALRLSTLGDARTLYTWLVVWRDGVVQNAVGLSPSPR